MGLNLGHLAEEWAKGLLRDPGQYFVPRTRRECTVCGHQARFMTGPGRRERRCPNCGSRERDRIIGLFLRRNAIGVTGKRILHFAPEASFYRQWRGMAGYLPADLVPTRTSERRIDITAIDFPDSHFDMIFCNHVLEHVAADRQGVAELHRVLKPDGLAIVSVPIMPGQVNTWTPPIDMPKAEVERICGYGHLRLYGTDFADLLSAGGFRVAPIAFAPDENVRHGLADEIVHVCRK